MSAQLSLFAASTPAPSGSTSRPKTLGDRRPAHLLDAAGDRRALCGAEALPKVLRRHAAAHVAGYGLPLCPACTSVANELDEAGTSVANKHEAGR